MKAQGIDGTIWVKDRWLTITKPQKGEVDISISTVERMHYESATPERYGYLQVGDDNQTIITFDREQEPLFSEIRDLIKRV